MANASNRFVFCYWAPRGLGEPARMLLEYCGIDYENRIVKSREEWDAMKDKQGLAFPNLPFIIDGDVKLTESWAIYKHIANKAGLVPETEEEERETDMLRGVVQDFRQAFSVPCYDPTFYSMVDSMLAKQRVKLSLFESFLQSKKYLLGDRLTYLDFALYETLDHHRLFSRDILKTYPVLQNYMKRFEKLDKIAAYFSSDRYRKFPITGPMAIWGSKTYNDLKE